MDNDPETAIARVVTAAVARVLEPALVRLGALELQLAGLATDTRATTGTVTAAIATLGGELGGLRDRLAQAERMPGPAGPAGRDGADGAPGRDGADGAPGVPGLRYRGVYHDGAAYDVGDVVTAGGSAWHCHAATDARPGAGGEATGWRLMVKCGRDGRDVKGVR